MRSGHSGSSTRRANWNCHSSCSRLTVLLLSEEYLANFGGVEVIHLSKKMVFLMLSDCLRCANEARRAGSRDRDRKEKSKKKKKKRNKLKMWEKSAPDVAHRCLIPGSDNRIPASRTYARSTKYNDITRLTSWHSSRATGQSESSARPFITRPADFALLCRRRALSAPSVDIYKAFDFCHHFIKSSERLPAAPVAAL